MNNLLSKKFRRIITPTIWLFLTLFWLVILLFKMLYLGYTPWTLQFEIFLYPIVSIIIMTILLAIILLFEYVKFKQDISNC